MDEALEQLTTQIRNYLGGSITSQQLAEWAQAADSDLPGFWQSPRRLAVLSFFLDQLMQEGLLPNEYKDGQSFRQIAVSILDALEGKSAWKEELHYQGDLFPASANYEGTVAETILSASGLSNVKANETYICDFMISIEGGDLKISEVKLVPFHGHDAKG